MAEIGMGLNNIFHKQCHIAGKIKTGSLIFV
jgi:hypothetical protein